MTDNSVTKCVLIYTTLFINFNRTIYHSKTFKEFCRLSATVVR